MKYLIVLILGLVILPSVVLAEKNTRPRYCPRPRYQYRYDHDNGVRDGAFNPIPYSIRVAPGFRKYHHFRAGALPPFNGNGGFLYFGYEIEF